MPPWILRGVAAEKLILVPTDNEDFVEIYHTTSRHHAGFHDRRVHICPVARAHFETAQRYAGEPEGRAGGGRIFPSVDDAKHFGIFVANGDAGNSAVVFFQAEDRIRDYGNAR